MIPSSIEDIWADVFHRLEKIEARIENRQRTGLTTQTDNQARTARVVLGVDPKTGKEMLSAPVTWDEPAMGAMRVHTPMADGEQVVVESENGEFTDARITRRVASDANQAPNQQHPDGKVRTIGSVTIVEKDGLVEITVGGTKLNCTNDGVEIKTGTLKITAAVEIEGDIRHNGNNNQSGVHVDSNGLHA